jgi:hypothetical protein
MALDTDKQLTRSQRLGEFVVDIIWARAPRRSPAPPLEPAWPDSLAFKAETLDAAYESLKQEHQAETDRIRTVETKLLGISGLAPVAMAVIVAAFTVLANRSLQAFTRISVLLVGIVGGYISLQLLRAILAAIAGLKRRSFVGLSLKDIYPLPNEIKDSYIRRSCGELAEVIRRNRAEIDAKVTWLDVAHTAIRNAVVGLLILVMVIICLAVSQGNSG